VIGVDVHFDYASPWSYLASEILERKLGGARVRWVPTYLRGLPSFASGIPYAGEKLAYLTRDLARCAAFEGIAVEAPAVFPINGLYALRGAIVAERRGAFAAYHRAIFRGAWRERRDISDPAVVVAIAEEAGVGDLGGALAEPSVKEELRRATEDARARGVFGVPTFVVGDELFWGHDRMEYVARELARRATAE
jgi:2-hydroxychromene-2-carboxylate isomerase